MKITKNDIAIIEGDEWHDIDGYVGLYKINKYGDIMSLNYKNTKTERILNKRFNEDGYVQVVLYKEKQNKSFKVHRLVAQTFIPNPDNKPQINHKNGIKSDNTIDNLEWCTNLENAQHSWRELGRKPGLVGEKHHKSKLKESDIFEIIKLSVNLPSRKVAKIYNINKSSVLAILKNKSWKHIQI